MTDIEGPFPFPRLRVRRRGHPRVVRARLRRGVWPAGASVLAGILAIAGRQTYSAWRDDWFDVSRHIHGSLNIVLPFAALFACWQGGLEARARTGWTDESSPRGPWARALLSFAPSVLWPLAVYGTALLAMLAIAWPTVPWGGPPWPMAAYALGVLTATVCTAHALGALLPLRVVPLIVTPFTVWGAGTDRDVLGYAFPSERPYLSSLPLEDAWLPWAALVLLLTVAVTVLVLRMRRRLVPGLLLVVVLALSVLELLPRGKVDSGVGIIGVHCSFGPPSICLPGDRAAQRTEVAEVAAHFTDRLAGVHGAPVSYLATSDPWSGSSSGWCCYGEGPVVTVHLDASRAERFQQTAQYIVASDTTRQGGDALLVAAVTDWLLPPEYRLARANLAVRDLVHHLSALPPAPRSAWLSQLLAQLRAGGPLPPLPKETPR
ncbi:hypothetical protein OG562_28950 [Streptomyces sp. NBC_01275]|uniref:hypothetical protein n=1 Tax=Streptomyces sp. NBC_01275 TaxID=2903807 RepID=UPI0022546E92|nr:hypothetical protein [Streptomyces sp. NBC_01275]MCX4764928.1 hypothetical protein [Streptomyces sp. NBC_01275]